MQQQICNLAFPTGIAYRNRKIGGWSTQTRCQKLDNLQTWSIVVYRFWNIKKQIKHPTCASKLNNGDFTIKSKPHNCKCVQETKHATEILRYNPGYNVNTSCVIDGRQGAKRSAPWQAKCKTGPTLSLYFGMWYVFSLQLVVVFLRFSECFPVISGFSINIHTWIQCHFPTFSECWLVGPLQIRLTPWLKPLVTPHIKSINCVILQNISVRHGDAGDAVASPTLKHWPLFGHKISTFWQSI